MATVPVHTSTDDQRGLPHTVGELLDVYSAHVVSTQAPKTQYATGFLLAHWRRDLGALPLDHRLSAALQQWREALEARYAPTTRRRFLGLMTRVSQFAVA